MHKKETTITLFTAIGTIIYIVVMGIGFFCYSIMMAINSKKTQDMFKGNFIKETENQIKEDIEEMEKD